jgi:hypothetical protein
MIARIWTGATRTSDASSYEAYMREVALPGYADVAGNEGVLMLRRDLADGTTEFTMVSLWDGYAAIRAFAGPDPDVAVFYPRDDELLVRRDLEARHYQVSASTLRGGDVRT